MRTGSFVLAGYERVRQTGPAIAGLIPVVTQHGRSAYADPADLRPLRSESEAPGFLAAADATSRARQAPLGRNRLSAVLASLGTTALVLGLLTLFLPRTLAWITLSLTVAVALVACVVATIRAVGERRARQAIQWQTPAATAVVAIALVSLGLWAAGRSGDDPQDGPELRVGSCFLSAVAGTIPRFDAAASCDPSAIPSVYRSSTLYEVVFIGKATSVAEAVETTCMANAQPFLTTEGRAALTRGHEASVFCSRLR
jgi:hypothetical protein